MLCQRALPAEFVKMGVCTEEPDPDPLTGTSPHYLVQNSTGQLRRFVLQAFSWKHIAYELGTHNNLHYLRVRMFRHPVEEWVLR